MVAFFVAVLLALVPTSSAVAAGATPPGDTVGGARLAGKGIVVAKGAPTPPQVTAASWLVADLDTGQVLAAKDPHGRFAPASTIKSLTALALLPVLPPDRRLTPVHDDIAVDGTRVGLVERVAYPVDELMGAMLMVSANDAAEVLARGAGGQRATATLMNETARRLGAADTRAVNPHGLDAPGQVSSAYDLALIAQAGLAAPRFARWVATPSASVGAPDGRRIATRNHNKLLGRYPGMLGIKNGYTVASRASFMGAAERDGHRIVVTLMRSDPKVFDQAKLLLDWGFAAVGAPAVGQLVEPESAALPVIAPPREPVTSDAVRALRLDGIAGLAPHAWAAPAAPGIRAAAPPASPSSSPSWLAMLAGLALAVAAFAAVRLPPERRAPAAFGVRQQTSARAARDRRARTTHAPSTRTTTREIVLPAADPLPQDAHLWAERAQRLPSAGGRISRTG